MDEVLHKLNAFLAPGADYPDYAAVDADNDNNSADATYLRIDKSLLEGLSEEEVFDLLTRELQACSPLLKAIREQYEHFFSLENPSRSEQVDLLSVLPTRDAEAAALRLNREAEDRLGEGDEAEVAPRRPEVDPSSLKSPRVRSRRLIDRQLQSGSASEPEMALASLRQLHGDANFDWERVRKCSQTLRGVFEVVPIYSRTFERVAERLSASRPLLASALLRVWKAHLEVLRAVMSRCKRDMAPDAEIARLVKTIERLTARYESNRQLVEQAAREIDSLNAQRGDLQRRLAMKEEVLLGLLEQERHFLSVEQDLEHVVAIAKQEFEAEEARTGPLEKERAPETGGADEAREEESHDHDENSSVKETRLGKSNDWKDAMDEDDEDDRAVSVSEMLERGHRGTTSTAADQRASTLEAVLETSSNATGETNDTSSESSDSFGDDLEAQEDSAIEAELAALNQEIEDVEREAERAREAREKEREARRRKQMIKVKDLDALKDLFAEVEELTLRFERAYSRRKTFRKHEGMNHFAGWENAENVVAALEKARPKKAAKSRGSSPSKRKASPSKRRRSPAKAGGRPGAGSSKTPPASALQNSVESADAATSPATGPQETQTSRLKALPLSRFDIPATVLAHFRTPTDDLVFQRGYGRMTWSLRNVFEAIWRVHMRVLDRRRRPNFVPQLLAREAADLFHEEYADADTADCAMANFHLSLVRYKASKVGVKVFRTLCDAPAAWVNQYYEFLQRLHPNMRQDSVDGALWARVDLILDASRSTLRAFYARCRAQANGAKSAEFSELGSAAIDAEDAQSPSFSAEEEDDAWRAIESELQEFACRMEDEADPHVCVDDAAMLLLQTGCFGEAASGGWDMMGDPGAEA